MSIIRIKAACDLINAKVELITEPDIQSETTLALCAHDIRTCVAAIMKEISK